MDVISNLIAQLREYWKSASTTGRIVTTVASSLVLLTVVGSAIWSSMPDYKPLRDNISPMLTAEIVSVLKTNGIPNRMNYSGTGVMVPTSRWNEANVAISSLSIADDPMSKAEPGLFPGKTSHDDAIRMREIALEKSLESLRMVKSADVHLAIPERSPFRGERTPPSASVIIEPQGRQVISREMQMSIVHMVASAVEGLDPKNVTLTNSDGTMSGPMINSDPAVHRREFVRQLEAERAMKAEDLLAAILGPGKSVVRVTAVVDDFLDKVTTVNKIESDAKVRLEEKITTSDHQGLPQTTAGPAGTSSNGLTASSLGSTTQQVSGKEETNETTYDYPRSMEKTREIGGQIVRLSISATVDVTPEDENGVPGTPLLTQQQVEGIVKSAVDFNEARDDQIEVVLSEFSGARIEAVTALPDDKKWEFVAEMARNASLGLAAVVALLIGVMTLKKLQPIEVKTPHEDNRRRELLSELSTRVDQNPEAVSRILAAWLGQDKGSDEAQATLPMKKAA